MEAATERLKPLTLSKIVETGRRLGYGNYGEVVEVRFNGLKCAGKKLRTDGAFFDNASPDQLRGIVSRFAEECLCLSNLRHPNIVQLMGVYFLGGGRKLPMMVMELLPGSLSQCLERHRQIPDHIKTSILYDVSLGLQYLHNQTPPLIHRDLTANNILLTTNMSAKLADLGVAKIMNVNPAQLIATMTPCPGAPAYMPPEALSDQPCYDEKLDVFCFGNLILHVCTHQWPRPAQPYLADNPQNPGMPIALTEVQRRVKYLDMVDKKNPLRALAEKCLQNHPQMRPSTANVVSELEQIHNSSAASPLEYLQLTIENKTLKERERQLMGENARLTNENSRLKAGNDPLKAEVVQLTDENAQLKNENALLKTEVDRLTDENAELTDGHAHITSEITHLLQQVHGKDVVIAELRKVNPNAPLPTVKRYSEPPHTICCPGRPRRIAITNNGGMIVTKALEPHVTLFTKEGNKTSFGSWGGNPGQFVTPMGVAVTTDSHILVADSGNRCIQKLTMTGRHVTSIGSHHSQYPQFSSPWGLALHPSGKIFISDIWRNNVHFFNADLVFSHVFGSQGFSQKEFHIPWDVVADSCGMVYIADSGNHRVQKFTPEGEFVMAIGRRGSLPGQLSYPISLTVDRMDNVYVGELNNHRISVFTCTGQFLYCFGESQFDPWGLATDESGHLYVCDANKDRVLIYY